MKKGIAFNRVYTNTVYNCSISSFYPPLWNTFWAIYSNIYHTCVNKGNMLPNSEQSYKGKVKTHNYINRQNQSTTGTL